MTLARDALGLAGGQDSCELGQGTLCRGRGDPALTQGGFRVHRQEEGPGPNSHHPRYLPGLSQILPNLEWLQIYQIYKLVPLGMGSPATDVPSCPPAPSSEDRGQDSDSWCVLGQCCGEARGSYFQGKRPRLVNLGNNALKVKCDFLE